MLQATVEELAERVLASASASETRFLVAIAGPPASGKSTLAESLVAALVDAGTAAALVPMDGFHLDNAVLEARGRLHRKGARDTFDGAGFVHMLHRLKSGEEVAIPVFDRSREIAIAAGRIVEKAQKICVVEGNYLLLDSAPWSRASDLWDMRIFLREDLEELERRLLERWRGFGYSPRDAANKLRDNDLPNAAYVLEHSTGCDLCIQAGRITGMSFSPHQGSG